MSRIVQPLRQAIHFMITTIGLVVWGSAMVFFCAAVALAYAAHYVMPESKWQNCWLFVLWKWHRYGGYLAVRPADGVRFLKRLPVPHAIWIQELPSRGVKMEYYAPLSRQRSDWIPWYTGYFRGRIRLADSRHVADLERYRAEMRGEIGE